MIFVAIFTLGYFAGVLTALFVFPPNTNELREQEIDTASPILEIERQGEFKGEFAEGVFENGFASN